MWRSWELRKTHLLRPAAGALPLIVGGIFRSFAGPLLFPAILAISLLWKTPLRPLLIATVVYLASFLIHMTFTPHYMAAATAAIYIVLLAALIRLSESSPRIGGAIVGLLPIGLAASVIYTTATIHFKDGRPLDTFENRLLPGNDARHQIAQRQSNEGKHLLLVRPQAQLLRGVGTQWG